MPTSPPASPDAYIEYRIIALAERLRRDFAECVGRYGLTAQQFSALFILDTHPELTVAELARRIFLTPQGTAKVITGLEDRQLIRRPTSRSRGRPAPITLTPAGHTVLRQAKEAVVDRDNAVRALLGEQRTKAFLETLDRLTPPSGHGPGQ